MKSDVGQWPGARVALRPIDEILPYARNARTHSPAQVAKIKGSMAEFGFVTPLLVDESGVLIAGHGRLLAAHSLGFAEVPVMVAEGWTPAQVRAYRITDNQLTLLGKWDAELLEGEVEELNADEYDLSLLGFDDGELDRMFASGGDTAEAPEEFKEYDEDIGTEYACPKCGYEWSGKQK